MNKTINEMRRYRFRLQMFAEEGSGGDGGQGDQGNGGSGDGNQGNDGKDGDGKDAKGGDSGKGEDGKGKDEGKRTYDDAEVDRIVAKHRKEWEKQHAKDIEEAKKEADKLAKMNKEQKEQYEKEKLEKQLADQKAEIDKLKAEANRAELSKTAAQIMKDDHEIVATPDMLDFVVADDAETTKENINKLVGIILDDRKAQDEKRARGTTPKDYRNNGDGGENDPYKAVVSKYDQKRG